MAQTIATPEAVAEAASALQAAGQEPTVILVQERTGGSFTTVKRQLEQWRHDQAAPLVTPPPAILAAGQQLITQVWQVAAAEIRAAQEAAQAQREAEQAPLHQQLAEAEQAITRLEQALEREAVQRQAAEQGQIEQRLRAERAEALAQAYEQRITQLNIALEQAYPAQHQAHETQLTALHAALSEQRQLMERLLHTPSVSGAAPAPRTPPKKRL